MTTAQGTIAGFLLMAALLIYTFWPENVFASQREKTRLDYLLERKEQLYENLRDLNFEYRPQISGRGFCYTADATGKRSGAVDGRDRSFAAGVKLTLAASPQPLPRFKEEGLFYDHEIDSNYTLHSCFEPAVHRRFGTGATVTGTVINKTPASPPRAILLNWSTCRRDEGRRACNHRHQGHYSLNEPAADLT